MTKPKLNIKSLFIVLLLVPMFALGQVDFNKTPDDDLGNVTDKYQENFFEALKQKGIENYERAITALQKCLDIDNTKPVIYFELGKNYNQLKNFGAAEDALKKAISMQPDNEWFLDELYDVYYRQDDIDNAIKTVKQLVKFHPDYKQDLATLYIKKEKFNAALSVLDELDTELGPDEVRDQMRNNIYNLTGDAGDRINNLKERIAADPNNENNYLQLIYRYSQTGKVKKAYEAAKELLKVKPDSKLVHLALYKFYLEEGRTEDAVSSMKLVLNTPEIDEKVKSKVLKDFVGFVEKNPQYQKDLIEATDSTNTQKDIESLSNLGTYYLKTGDKEKALQNYKEALKQAPDDFKLLRDVILIHIDLQQYEDALKQSESALELYPAQPILYLLNGVSNINLNKPQSAIDSLEMGLDFLVENPKMERDFYIQLSEAYKLTNNNAQSKAFAKKAQAIKLQK
ncbi:tetratricopeptide repeat protein [Winogradskyella jejuensis]|uniref:Tetratricopeptide repeat-containing protein n=1 Tax=Winogradskyella jejuensis TaxID=1089305 RepID=A0A1M5MNM8_9FLAO|nr:tetratricopeptide repeat protein [Winogradskyella jejuensis]SHG79034.1 Tetratricopeptide repeat-containing protein [Winogradskyella jejuensis]